MNDKKLEEQKRRLSKDDPNYKQKREILSCIEMINSYTAYDWRVARLYESPETLLKREMEKEHYNYLKDYVDALGFDTVCLLIKGQFDDVEDVQTNVFTDDEGCSYNSIIWKED